jgi:hypothetical protein
MKDSDIRAVLKNKILRRYLKDQDTVIIDELGINNGSSRVDVALVNGTIHGFEIKSDCDSLARLPDQIRAFCEVLDRVTLVVGYKLAGAALKMIPNWWGVKLAEQIPTGEIRLAEARSPRNNPQLDKLSIIKFLWREEALELLEEIASIEGFKLKPRKYIYEKLADVAELDVIRSRVRYQLKNRKDWRVVARQM